MENKNKNNILLTIIAVLTLLVAIIGASFAYFSATGTSQSQSISTGKLNVIASSSSISETGIEPTTWDSVMNNNISNNNIAKLPFTVNTTGTNIPSEYNIFLTTTGISLTEGKTGGSLSDVKWVLIKDSDNSVIVSGNFADGNMTKSKLNTTPIPIVPGIDSYKLLFYILDNNDPQNQLQNIEISATVSVEGKQK